MKLIQPRASARGSLLVLASGSSLRSSFTRAQARGGLGVRSALQSVKVTGKALKLKLDVGKRKPELVLNGETRPAAVRDGYMEYSAEP